MKQIFILVTLVYLTLMYVCYNEPNVISLINMLFMTLIYIAFIIAMSIVNSDKEKQN